MLFSGDFCSATNIDLAISKHFRSDGLEIGNLLSEMTIRGTSHLTDCLQSWRVIPGQQWKISLAMKLIHNLTNMEYIFFVFFRSPWIFVFFFIRKLMVYRRRFAYWTAKGCLDVVTPLKKTVACMWREQSVFSALWLTCVNLRQNSFWSVTGQIESSMDT